MKYWEGLKTYLLEEEHQRKVNRFLCFSLFSIIGIQLLEKAYYALPKEPLWFFTSDSFEFFVATVIAYVFYYKIRNNDSLFLRICAILFSLLLFIGIGFLKCHRRGVLYEHVYSEVTSYVTMTFLFLSLFYLFDNLNLFINNSFEKTKKALGEAERQLLREQFSPHFLYNAFNSLYSMSLQNHPKTSDSILKLTGMMRYLTDEVSTSGSLLRQEFKFINDYLEIERIRFGKEANISFDIEGEVGDQIIEPLILINLVENAFKHGFYTNNDKAYVHIKAIIKEAQLSFTVKNSRFEKQHFQKTNRIGKGLTILRKRLALAYSKNAKLNISESEKEYIAVLAINLNQ